MKKVLFLVLAGFLSAANAHHMAQSDAAGVNIVEWSPHLLMEF